MDTGTDSTVDLLVTLLNRPSPTGRNSLTEDSEPYHHVYASSPAIHNNRVFAVDLMQHKQRQDNSNKVTQMMGGSTKSFGASVLQESPVTLSTELTTSGRTRPGSATA